MSYAEHTTLVASFFVVVFYTQMPAETEGEECGADPYM
jgi:hypothetical protein